MACDVFDAFKVPTESLGNEISRNASYRSVWLNVVPRETYKSGTGLTQTTFSINNVEPTADDEAWAAITLANGTGQGACAQTYNEVPVGFDEMNYSPEGFGLKGPQLCKDDLVFDHKVDLFLRAYIQELTTRAQRSLEKRYESIYMQNASKVVLSSNAANTFVTRGKPYSGATGLLPGLSVLALPKATSTLAQGHLDTMAIELIDAGATNPDSSGFISWGETGPLFSLYIGLDASARLLANSPALQTAYQYAAPSELIKRLGASRIIGNFRHIPNLRPPRFTYGGTLTVTTTSGSPTLTAVTNNGINVTDAVLAAFGILATGTPPNGVLAPITGTGIPAGTFIGAYNGGASGAATLRLVTAAGVDVNATASATITATTGTAGQYTRVNTWLEQAATGKGKKPIVNPAWKSAPFEGAYVLSPRVFVSEIVRPVNSVAGLSWEPRNYMGEWEWITGGERINSTCTTGSDPLHKLGAHFAEFKHAPRPEFPAHGMTIIFKRCGTSVTDVAC